MNYDDVSNSFLTADCLTNTCTDRRTTHMDENVLNTQFIFGHQHTHIQGEQAKGGKQRERGGGTRDTAPAQG